MRTTWLELRTECARCLSPIPINLIANTIACPRCGTSVDVSPDVSLAQVVEGREGQVGMFGNAGAVQGRFGPADLGPACARCAAPLDMKRAHTEGAAPCTHCGERATCRPIPEALAEKVPPGATHLVGESLASERARDGETPLVSRFYLWADPDVSRRAAAERLRKRRRFAPVWITLGIALAAVGVSLFLRKGEAMWRLLGEPAAPTITWATFFGALGGAFLGAIFLAHGTSRYSKGASILFSLVGLLLAAGCGLFLYLKGFAPWAATGEAVGAGLFVYLLAKILPSGITV